MEREIASQFDAAAQQERDEQKRLRADFAQHCRRRTADLKCTAGGSCGLFISGKWDCPAPDAAPAPTPPIGHLEQPR
jgi:hypothetical protein